MTEVIAGRIDFFFGPVGLVLPHIQEGKLRALVVNGVQAFVRTAQRPDDPGSRGRQMPSIRFGLGCSCPPRRHARSSTKLHSETLKALQSAQVREKLAALGVDPMPISPADFTAHVRKEIATNAALVRAAGLK